MKEINYAVIGCGSFGRKHIDAIKQMAGLNIIALCDKHSDKAEEAKTLFGLDNAVIYDDFNKMLSEISADVVVVAVADQIHAEATVAAFRAGANVLCEKPMALLRDDCQKMLDAQKKSGKLLLVGQVSRYAPGFIKAQEIVASGLIGELCYVESEYAHDYAGIPGTDNWRTTPEREPIIGGACHAIDLLRWIAGDPESVFAYSSHKILTDWPVNDTTVSIMRFPNDVIGKVFCSIGCKRDYTMRTCLYGTKGTVIVNNIDPEITVYLEKTENREYFANCFFGEAAERTIKHVVPVPINNHNLEAEHAAMRDAIINGKEFITTGLEGAKTVAVCHAVVESEKTGQPVKVDYNFN